MPRDLDQFLDRDVRLLRGVMGMRPNRAEYILMRLDDGLELGKLKGKSR
jgi:hypothetical protein